MAKFDVYRSPDGIGYLLDCQADLLQRLGTRFVVPLLPTDQVPGPVPRLNPVFLIDGRDHVMATHLAATVPVYLLRQRHSSLIADELAVGNALDMLISGF